MNDQQSTKQYEVVAKLEQFKIERVTMTGRCIHLKFDKKLEGSRWRCLVVQGRLLFILEIDDGTVFLCITHYNRKGVLGDRQGNAIQMVVRIK